MINYLKRHALFKTLIELDGNARGCLYPEPLWGIPYNLYMPFATLYMYALGLREAQIGLLVSIGFIMQIFTLILAGVVTDKMGRRRATLIFDTLSWSVPCLIWAFAQNFWWFLAATALNAFWQVTMVSWTLLLVDDTDPKKLVHIYTWCTVSGLIAVFVTPLSGWLVARFSLVSAVRVLYFNSFVWMTIKFLIVNAWTKETSIGLKKIEENQHTPLWRMALGYKDICKAMLAEPQIVTLLLIIAIFWVTNSVTSTFFTLYANKHLGIPDAMMPLFTIVRACIMLPFIFFIQHRIDSLSLKVPMLVGAVLYIASQLILIFAPSGNYVILCVYILLEAFAFAVLVPRRDSLMVYYTPAHERARMTSLICIFGVAIASPFGYIAGRLSEMNGTYPFILNIVLFVIVAVVIAIRVPVTHEVEAEAANASEA